MSKRTLSDELWKGLGDAVSDIRQKVIEEPFWGRALGEPESEAAPQWPEAEQQPAFGSVTRERECEPPAPDVDLDR